MRYRTLATDYDGTLATHGVVDDATLDALRGAREAGIRLVLVSGRQLESLQRIFSHFELFDLMVLENGGVVYESATSRLRALCEPPLPAFLLALRERGVHPLSVGRVIVATFVPHETTVLEVIRELGLELQVIFNKGAVMVLPSGVNKATGLREALVALATDPKDVVGVGDAENDHALLEMCGIGAAVANALPALKERADYVASADHGAGVAEILDRMMADALRSSRPSPSGESAATVAARRVLADEVDVHPDA